MVSPPTMMIRRSITLRSSRTLPGQPYCCSRAAASGASRFGRRPYSAASSAMKCSASIGMSCWPLAQRRHEDRDDVQAEVQILAEPAGADLRRQILVGRRQHAHVDLDALRAADALHHLFLQHAQHLRLRLQAHVGDLVEEDRAAVGLLEASRLVGDRAGERAAHVAEQLRLDQLFRNRGAVHFDERPALAPARCDESCARPAPCRCRSRRESARGRWSAPPATPARAGGASPGSRPPSCAAAADRPWRAGRGSRLRGRAGAARCAPPARSSRATAASR